VPEAAMAIPEAHSFPIACCFGLHDEQGMSRNVKIILHLAA